MVDWQGTKPGTFVDNSTIEPVSAENLNAIVNTIDRIATGGEDSGVDADTIRGADFDALATTSDETLTNFYSFDSLIGSASETFLDDSGLNLHGTAYSVSPVKGIVNMAGSFNGTSSFASAPYTNKAALTLALWYKGTATGDKPLMLLKRANNAIKICLCLSSGSPSAKFLNSDSVLQTLTDTTVINDGLFHHIAVTHSGTICNLYVDGKLKQSSNQTLTTAYYNQLIIGASEEVTPTIFTSGIIDDARVYSSALSLNQTYGLFFNKINPSSKIITSTNKANSQVYRDASGNFAAGTISAALTGNASTATKLATPRSIQLSGDVTTVSQNFDGSANVSLTVTVTDDSHGHTGSTLSGITKSMVGLANVDNTADTAKPVSTAQQTALNLKANLASPTFTGTPTLPTGTIGVTQAVNTNSTTLATTAFVNAEIANDTVSKSIFTAGGQVVSSTASGTPSLVPAGTSKQALVSNGSSAPTFQTLDLTNLPDAAFKKSVKCATTANLTATYSSNVLTMSAVGVISLDGITPVLYDRILIKDQTTALQNGIYSITTLGKASVAAIFTRVSDANTISTIAGSVVNVDSGTANGGILFSNNLKTTDTLGTTSMLWYKVLSTADASVTASNKLVLRDASGNFTTAGKATLSNVLLSGQTATTVPYLDASKNLISSAVTPTQLGYLSGVTSAIQTQFDVLQDFRTWDSTRTYALNDPVFYLGVPYRALQASNLNHTPSTSPTYWEVTGGGSSASESGDLIIDSNTKLATWAASGTYAKVLIKAGTWTLPTGGVDLTVRGTKLVVGEPGSKLVFSASEKGLYYTTLPTTKAYRMEGVTVECSIAGDSNASAIGFHSCTNLTNCTGTGTGTSTGTGYGYGFSTCTNLTNCTGTGTGTSTGTGYGYGFSTCTNLTNCTGTGTGTGTVYGYGYGFSTCTNLTNCTGTGTSAGNGYGFRSCTNLTNCTGTGTGTSTGTGTGFYNCTNLTNCTGTGSGSGTGYGYGFSTCTNLTNCTGTGTGTGTVYGYGYGFSTCTNLTNCTGTGTSTGTSAGNGYGFRSCTKLTNCTGTGTSAGTGYGFYDCNKMQQNTATGTTAKYNTSYADSGSSYACADTPNGGFNS